VLAGLILAPLGTALVWRAAARIRKGRFAAWAALAHVLLPVVFGTYFFGAYRHLYWHDVLPWAVGLRAPAWFALGVGLAAAVAVLPRFLLGPLGVAAFAAGSAVWGFGLIDEVRLGGIHETAWSVGTLEYLLAAGLLGTLLRSPFLGAALGGWFWLVFLRATHHSYETGAFWRALAAAVPATTLLVSSVALLVPPLPQVRLRWAGRALRRLRA
jgi:hypothetical protein